MPALSERKIEIVRTLVEAAPDNIVGSLQRALAETGHDTALADVRQLVEAEARDRRLRNAVLQPIAGLCSGITPGETALKFPSKVLVHIWRGLATGAAPQVAEAAAALLDYSRDEPPPEVYDQLSAIATESLKASLAEARVSSVVCEVHSCRRSAARRTTGARSRQAANCSAPLGRT